VIPLPHVLCGGFYKEETEYLLVDCHYLGINNVMALRGDAMKDEHFCSKNRGNSIDLVQQIKLLNEIYA
jgi:methylenetetrahydrofolate reductase (NADPH)